MHIEIITETYIAALKLAVNKYLRMHNDIDIVDIKYALSDYRASAMIIYKESYNP